MTKHSSNYMDKPDDNKNEVKPFCETIFKITVSKIAITPTRDML